MFRLLRLTRTLFLLILIVALAGMAACFVNAGHMLVDRDALQPASPADAIIVLSGAPADRWLEAYELWRAGVAPVIVVSPGYRDGGSMELVRRGVHVPAEHEIARDIMTGQLGVPASAIRFMKGPLDNTAAEAAEARELAQREGWRRLIVVTSVAHTRRTALAMRRVLEPAGITVQVRGSRFDRFQASRWWQSRGSIRWMISEFPKLMAYRMGLAE